MHNGWRWERTGGRGHWKSDGMVPIILFSMLARPGTWLLTSEGENQGLMNHSSSMGLWERLNTSSSWACISLKICPGPRTQCNQKESSSCLYFHRGLRRTGISTNTLLNFLPPVYEGEHIDWVCHGLVCQPKCRRGSSARSITDTNFPTILIILLLSLERRCKSQDTWPPDSRTASSQQPALHNTNHSNSDLPGTVHLVALWTPFLQFYGYHKNVFLYFWPLYIICALLHLWLVMIKRSK